MKFKTIKAFTFLASMFWALAAFAGGLESINTDCEEYAKLDKEMNRLYRKVFKEYDKDKLFLEKFAASQAAWEKFRDAYVESIFPGGNQTPRLALNECVCSEKSALTISRINQIVVWLEGSMDPSECESSVKPTLREEGLALTIEDLGDCGINADNLRIYSDQSLDSKIIGTAKKGDSFETLEIGSDSSEGVWFKIRIVIPSGTTGIQSQKAIVGWIFGNPDEIIKCR